MCDAQVVEASGARVFKRFGNIGCNEWAPVNVNITRKKICVSGTCEMLYDDDDRNRWVLTFSKLSTWRNEGGQTDSSLPNEMPSTRIVGITD